MVVIVSLWNLSQSFPGGNTCVTISMLHFQTLRLFLVGKKKKGGKGVLQSISLIDPGLYQYLINIYRFHRSITSHWERVARETAAWQQDQSLGVVCF